MKFAPSFAPVLTVSGISFEAELCYIDGFAFIDEVYPEAMNGDDIIIAAVEFSSPKAEADFLGQVEGVGLYLDKCEAYEAERLAAQRDWDEAVDKAYQG